MIAHNIYGKILSGTNTFSTKIPVYGFVRSITLNTVIPSNTVIFKIYDNFGNLIYSTSSIATRANTNSAVARVNITENIPFVQNGILEIVLGNNVGAETNIHASIFLGTN